MATVNYLDRFLEPISDAFTPQMARTIVELRAEPELQAHVDALASKASAGTLTAEEDAEYHTGDQCLERKLGDALLRTDKRLMRCLRLGCLLRRIDHAVSLLLTPVSPRNERALPPNKTDKHINDSHTALANTGEWKSNVIRCSPAVNGTARNV